MKNTVIKSFSILMVILLILTTLIGCSERNVNSEKSAITKEEAYSLYYDTIKRFVPEIMAEPQESDVEIETRDEVTYLDQHFVRNTKVKIESQNVDGKLQYYLLNEFPEANKMDLYCINGDKFYSASSDLNVKVNLKEVHSSRIANYTFVYLNTPLFEQDAIKSFSTETKDTDTVVSFVINGADMEYGYAQRVMKEINADYEDNLDDVKIVLTIDANGKPKTMSTEISMSIFNDAEELFAKKILNMNFVFNKLDNVDFDLENIVSQYTLDASVIK